MPNHPTHPAIALLDGAFYADDPHPHYDWMRAQAPLYWDETADGGLWGIAGYDDIMEVSRQPELFCSGKSSRPERGSWIPSMINFDDPHHKRRRNLVNRGFTPRRVAAHEPMLRKLTTELLDAVSPRGECDFVSEVAQWIPMAVIGDMLGMPREDHATLLHWSDELLGGGALAEVEDDDERRVRQTAVVVRYVEYAKAIVADRKARPRDDLMSILVNAELDGDRLSEEEILQESLLILIGGDETTRHVMTGGLLALIQNPAEKQKLTADPRRHILSAVEELLRRFPDVELASSAPLPIRPSNFIVGLEKMPVRFTAGG